MSSFFKRNNAFNHRARREPFFHAFFLAVFRFFCNCGANFVVLFNSIFLLIESERMKKIDMRRN